MLRRSTPAGRTPAEIVRHHCTLCGEDFDTIRLTVRDVVDHHCGRLGRESWWIVRRTPAPGLAGR